MGSQWPPSPRVEDEESALKHEVTHKSEESPKSEAEEAHCRGTVDQYPIILDVNHKMESKHDYTSSTDNEGESVRTQSSDDSYGPATPPISKAGRKHAQIPPNPPNSQARSGKETPKCDIAQEEDTSRGRQNMPRIQTDLGSDLEGMITGQRRAPSPYSYTKPDAAPNNDSHKRFSGHAFLSPEGIVPTQPFPTTDNNKRHSSARPRPKPSLRKDSEDSTDSERRRRRHSRRRSTQETFSMAQESDNRSKESFAGENRSSYYAYSRAMEDGHSRKDSDSETSNRRHAREDHDKRSSKEPPYTSSAEDSWSRSRSDFVSRSDKCHSKESSCPSSAEEGRTHPRDPTHSKESEERRSQRGPVGRKERPRLDLSRHQYSYHRGPTEERQSSAQNGKHGNPLLDGRNHLEPSSVRSPKAMEEYLEKAFKDKRVRSHTESPHPSPAASPRGSPPSTPSRTPRGDRRSRDYFSLGTSASLRPSETTRPRALSYGDSDRGQIKPLAGVLATAAGATQGSSLSRCSTSSTELHSSGYLSTSASGRRSRNTSPIREQRSALPSSEREHEKFSHKPLRDEEWTHPRPVSRSGSTSYNLPSVASSDRLSSRSGSYAVPPSEMPRLNHRAFSYSASDESKRPRQPSSAKSAHFHLGTPTTPKSAPLPITTAPAFTLRLPRSPSSSEKAPRVHHLSELPPCPRSLPKAGHYDWFTVVGMPELDVCPSCMTVLGTSRFGDMFVPSTSKVPGQRVLCDFSRMWVRHAWAQIIKQRRKSLDMIYQIVRNSETTKSCPGKGSDVRAWYRLPDPDTDSNVPNFDACSECVRSIEIIFPQLRGIFKRSGALVQERTCDLNTQSRRFDNYIRLLEEAALQYDVERLREPDIRRFACYARKTARVRECTRDDMVMGQLWHFIPSLPEFTICEECFDQVVWPVADQPVASSINRTLQLVPGTRRNPGISCQLYSERMRKKFLEAVKYADFEFLKQIALRRHGVERQLQEKHKMLMSDMAMGKDRTAELQANIEEWRKWE